MDKRIGRSLVWLAGATILVYMGWNLIFSDHGYLVYRQEVTELKALKEQVTLLKQQRERISAEILRLRNDPDAMVELIHRELGYVYPDEFMLVLPEKSKASTTEDTKDSEETGR